MKKLSAEEGVYRIRDGDFRIVYTIEDRKLLILLLSVGNRRDIYNRHPLASGARAMAASANT